MNLSNLILSKIQLIFSASLLMLSAGVFGTTMTLHGTGFDSSGNPLASGNVDGNWSLSGGFTGSNQAYFIAPGNPDWWSGGVQNEYAGNSNTSTFSGSGWISNNASSNVNGPAPYTFSMQFDLSLFDLNTVSIAGQWAIANGGSLDVNGHLVSNLPGTVVSNWDSLHPFSMINTTWLNSGLNTINLTVTDSNEIYEAARFEGSVTGDLAQQGTGSNVSEPATLLLFIFGLAGIVIGKPDKSKRDWVCKTRPAQ